MLTKLLTTSGNDVEYTINPQAIIKGNTSFLLKPKFLIIAKAIGVKIKVAPSLAKNAAIIAPNIMINTNIFNPCPCDALTICMADHSKNPISSRINEIRITATMVSVAF